jgi:hypothetical protein
MKGPSQLELITHVMGKPEIEASSWIRQSGYSVCVYFRDGVAYFKTHDLDFNRVNLKIKDGIVLDAHTG